MKKKLAIMFVLVLIILGLFSVIIFATNTNVADLKNDSTVNLVQIKDRELENLQEYQEAYGDATYGFVAYILNIVRIYSIPLGFVDILVNFQVPYLLFVLNSQ